MITKGDWKLLADNLTIVSVGIEYEPHYDADPPQTLIAKCFQNGHLGRTKRPTEEDFANARLIAAAKDLLAALKKREWVSMNDTAKFRCPVCMESKENGHRHDCKVALAIAKAEK